MQDNNTLDPIQNLKEDVTKALIICALVNISALILMFLGEQPFAFAIWAVQIFLFIFLLVPVFLYYLLKKKKPVKIAMHRSLYIYREIFENASW